MIHLAHALKEQRWLEWTAILLLSLLLTGVLYWNSEKLDPESPWFSNPWDHHKYIRMAEQNPFDFHIAPFCWRVGVPLLVRLMPLAFPAGFLLVSLVSVWLTGPTIYLLCRNAGLHRSSALAGLLLFHSIGWVARFPLMVYWGPDALSHLLAVLAISCIFARRDFLFSLLLLLGCLVKENVLFVLPLHYSLQTCGLIEPRRAIRTLLLGTPAVMLLVFLRLAIPAWNHDPVYINALPETLTQVQNGVSSYQPALLFRTVGLERLANFGLREMGLYTADAFGLPAALLVLLLLTSRWWAGGVPESSWFPPILFKYLPFLLLAYGQLLFSADEQRLVVFGFPAVIMLALEGWNLLHRRSGLPVQVLFVLPLLLTLLNAVDRTRPTARLEYQLLLVTLYAAGIYIVKRLKNR